MNVREKSLFILDNVIYKDKYLNKELELAHKLNLNKKDFNLLTNIVSGTIQNKLYIDYIIDKNSKIKIKKMQKLVILILELSIYQILFLDRIPDYSILNEAVNLTKKFVNVRAANFVNAILRNITKNKNNFEFNLKDVEYLSVYYSHPKFFINEMLKNHDYNFVENLLIANNKKPPFTIRVNTLKIDKMQLIENLQNKNYSIKICEYAKDGLIIENPENIFNTDEFKNGYFYVQDEASILVSEILNPKKNSNVLDLCSAPGGKSTHMSALMENTGHIISCDISIEKLDIIKENINRLGINNIDIMNMDATVYNENFKDKFDYILVDAPCSGFGLVRRKPDIKLKRKVEDIETLSEIQFKILMNAYKYLKRNGTLVYSTCTEIKDENENLINKFLELKEDMILEDINNKKYLKLYPNIENTDGFSIFKLKKMR